MAVASGHAPQHTQPALSEQRPSGCVEILHQLGHVCKVPRGGERGWGREQYAENLPKTTPARECRQGLAITTAGIDTVTRQASTEQHPALTVVVASRWRPTGRCSSSHLA
jgi:hypothetical protein